MYAEPDWGSQHRLPEPTASIARETAPLARAGTSATSMVAGPGVSFWRRGRLTQAAASACGVMGGRAALPFARPYASTSGIVPCGAGSKTRRATRG